MAVIVHKNSVCMIDFSSELRVHRIHFKKIMGTKLSGLPYAATYIDDIVVVSISVDENRTYSEGTFCSNQSCELHF